MGIEIIPYQPDYLDGVDALWREAFPHDAVRNNAKAAIPIKLTVQPELFLVAVDRGQVVGSVVAGFDGYRGWLNRVAVLQTHRRRGIGVGLIKEAERRLVALGCVKINLQINGANESVKSFYDRLGYSVEERISMGKIV